MKIEQILYNAAKCVRCGHILHSTHVHDYKTHSCDESIWFMVDGGTAYIRRGWKEGTKPEDNFLEASVHSATLADHEVY